MVRVNFLGKVARISIIVILMLLLVSCSGGAGSAKFENVDGQKKYKKDNGEMAQAEWVTIDGNDYYFDMNGYLQTDKWIDDLYRVDSNGKKLVKAWWTDPDSDKTYYLSSNGSYLKDTLVTIDNKDYYFSKDGSLIKNKVFLNSDNKYMYADEKGIINNSGSLININNDTYYVDKMGIIFTGGWKEIDKDWYYFNHNGPMKKNEWYEATYYFDENGKMLKNAKSPEGYEVDGDGKVLEQYKSELLAKDFKYIYQVYCKYPWGEVGKDGSYISIDTNPGDLERKEYGASIYIKEASDAIEEILKNLGFPDYVYKNMNNTSYADGKQTETSGDVTVTWGYHPDKGLEVMFMKKK